ncbi:hypothetical protein IAT40_003238 [Kwoniella sp. CBS 6097]
MLATTSTTSTTTTTTKKGVGNTPSVDTWVYDHLHQVYFHPLSNTYAVPDPNSKTGEWSYIPAAQFHAASTSTSTFTAAATATSHDGDGHDASGRNDPRVGTDSRVNGVGKGKQEEKEEGEIEDDVGWGGLMEPDKLAEIERETAKNKVYASGGTASGLSYSYGHGIGSGINTPLISLEKHPAYGGGRNGNGVHRDTVVPYDDPKLYAYPSTYDDNDHPEDNLDAKDMTIEGPNHILRLVVLSSECLDKGLVALIDTREGGIQIGRDRCERGGTPRFRCREMRVSKTHAVVYWSPDSQNPPDPQGRGMAEAGGDGQEDEGWWIVDLGSTHGTFISRSLVSPAEETTSSSGSRKRSKPHRLSEPKHSSKPCSLTHLSRLIIGSTTFEVHLHPSTSWPCDTCQIGKEHNEIPIDDGEPPKPAVTDQAARTEADQADFKSDIAGQKWAMDSKQRRENRELKRKREMAHLRETLLNRDSPGGSGISDDATPPPKAREYLDRSAMRRKLHPPSPPPTPSRGHSASTSTSALERNGKNKNKNNLNNIAVPTKSAYPTSSSAAARPPSAPVQNGTPGIASGVSSIASGILASQGWIPGQGLGKDGAGRADPVQAEMRNARAGLGVKGGKAYTDPCSSLALAPGGGGEMDWKMRAKMRRWDELSKGP